jgi:hypothetical protein
MYGEPTSGEFIFDEFSFEDATPLEPLEPFSIN